MSAKSAAADAAEKARYLNSFNKGLRVLIQGISGLYPNDAVVHRVRTRVIAALQLTPTVGISQMGPYLWKYRTEIWKRDRAFFVAKSGEVGSDSSADPTEYIIGKLRTSFLEMSEADQQEYFDLVTEMLDSYVEWL